MRKTQITLPGNRAKYRKTGKAIELKGSFERDFITELAALPMLAPLVEDCMPGEPDLDKLKDLPQMQEFARKLGRQSAFTFFVRSEHGENVEKAICLLDDNNRACAFSMWKRGEGITFEIDQ